MTLKQELDKNLRELIKKLGSEKILSERSSITQANINKIKNGHVSFDSIRIGTLQKLFPDMRIDFSGTGSYSGHIGEIIKMLQRLSKDDQLQIMLDIAAHYPECRDKAFRPDQFRYGVEEDNTELDQVAEDSIEYNKRDKE